MTTKWVAWAYGPHGPSGEMGIAGHGSSAEKAREAARRAYGKKYGDEPQRVTRGQRTGTGPGISGL